MSSNRLGPECPSLYDPDEQQLPTTRVENVADLRARLAAAEALRDEALPALQDISDLLGEFFAWPDDPTQRQLKLIHADMQAWRKGIAALLATGAAKQALATRQRLERIEQAAQAVSDEWGPTAYLPHPGGLPGGTINPAAVPIKAKTIMRLNDALAKANEAGDAGKSKEGENG